MYHLTKKEVSEERGVCSRYGAMPAFSLDMVGRLCTMSKAFRNQNHGAITKISSMPMCVLEPTSSPIFSLSCAMASVT